MPEPLAPIADIARALRKHRSTIWRACERGDLAGAVLTHTLRGDVWLVPARYAKPDEYERAVGRKAKGDDHAT